MCWEKTKWRIAREELVEEEVAFRVEDGLGVSRNISFENGGEDCWAIIFSWFREYDLQRKQGVHGSQTEKKEMRQHQRHESRERYDKEHQVEGQNGDSELLAADCEKAWMGSHYVAMI